MSYSLSAYLLACSPSSPLFSSRSSVLASELFLSSAVRIITSRSAPLRLHLLPSCARRLRSHARHGSAHAQANGSATARQSDDPHPCRQASRRPHGGGVADRRRQRQLPGYGEFPPIEIFRDMGRLSMLKGGSYVYRADLTDMGRLLLLLSGSYCY